MEIGKTINNKINKIGNKTIWDTVSKLTIKTVTYDVYQIGNDNVTSPIWSSVIPFTNIEI
jgi:hypothetical protein